MSDEETVSREEFDNLWNELVSFRQTSAELETALNQQLDDQQKEVRRLTRALRDEQAQKEHWEEQCRELQAKEAQRFHDQDQNTAELLALRQKVRAMEEDQAALRRVEGGIDIEKRRMTEERDQAVDRAIIAESTLEEVQEALQEAQKETKQLRVLLAEAKQQQQHQQVQQQSHSQKDERATTALGASSSSSSSAASPYSRSTPPTRRELELEQAMLAIAARAQQIFLLCQRRLHEQGKPPLQQLPSVLRGGDFDSAAAAPSPTLQAEGAAGAREKEPIESSSSANGSSLPPNSVTSQHQLQQNSDCDVAAPPQPPSQAKRLDEEW